MPPLSPVPATGRPRHAAHLPEPRSRVGRPWISPPLLVALALITAVTAALFYPLVWGLLTGEPRYFEWDVPEQYWPDLVGLCGSLHRGELPLWSPHDRFGYPLLADPQAGTWSPLNWGICAVAGSSPGPGWAVARVVAGFWMAGALGLLWLRGLRIPWTGAAAGAVLLQTAPFMRHNWELNLTGALALAPLVLWALDRLTSSLSWRDGVLLGVAWGLCAQVGSPPALWQVSSFATLYGAWRLSRRLRSWAALRRALLALGAAATMGALLSAVLLVPGMVLAGESVQAGRSLADIASGGLDPSWLWALVWPRPGNHLYLGLLPLALAGLALWREPSRRWPLAALAAGGVLMAMGEHTPVFGWASHLIPGVDLFRLPHRYEAWLGLAAAPLVGWGAAELLALLRWTGPRELGLTALLAAVILVDASRVLPRDRHTRAGPHPGTHSEAILSLLEPGARVFDEFGISCRPGTRLGLMDGRGYQDPLLLKSTERVWSSLGSHPGLLEQYGVRYVLTGPHFLHGQDRNYLPPLATLLARPGVRDLGHGVLMLQRALPEAWWAPARAIESAPDRASSLARVRELAPAAVVILEGGGDYPGEAVPSGPLAVQILDQTADRTLMSVQAPERGVVVLNHAWYPGWEARVDGELTPVLRASGLVRAIEVGPGSHRVELRFRPWERHLRWAWLLGWLAALLTALGPALKRREGKDEARDRSIREETTDQTKDTPGGHHIARSPSI